MKQVAIFENKVNYGAIDNLEKQINDFILSISPVTFIDIKYSVSRAEESDLFSALVIYEQK